MVEKEQVRPLAPATDRPSSVDDDETAPHVHKIRRKRCIKCFGYITALMLIPAVVIVILIFTVFRVKDPIITMNGVTVTTLELINNTAIPKPGANMSLTANVSVKNPNVAAFKYSNTTTALFYHGTVVGEARGPPGQAKPWRTMQMNITIDIITDRVMSTPNLQADLSSGVLRMSSYSRVPGRVKILDIIKKHVVVKMNCTLTLNISSQAIKEQKCKRKVSF